MINEPSVKDVVAMFVPFTIIVAPASGRLFCPDIMPDIFCRANAVVFKKKRQQDKSQDIIRVEAIVSSVSKFILKWPRLKTQYILKSVLSKREQNGKSCSFAFLCFNFYFSSMCFYNIIAQR